MSLTVSATEMLQGKYKYFKIYFEDTDIKIVGIPNEINKK